ncbi:MAG TPA: hypothetical protein VEV41_28200 [Terriglobales bacterium]|nr:hypothetical protein [Terriglobales bacterium]
MKLKATSLAATFLLGLIPAVCQAQDFSADVVYVATSKSDAPSTGTGTLPHQSSKLYVSKDKMRLETRGLTGTILLVNGGEHTAVALLPAQKAYQPLGSGPSEYFRVQDAEDACPDWQKAADQKIVCEKVGHEVVDGRQTVKYQNKSASADALIAALWIDPTLNFPIKWQGSNTGAELRNIKEGQQSADLFAIPQGYGVLKPQKMQLRMTGRTR